MKLASQEPCMQGEEFDVHAWAAIWGSEASYQEARSSHQRTQQALPAERLHHAQRLVVLGFVLGRRRGELDATHWRKCWRFGRGQHENNEDVEEPLS